MRQLLKLSKNVWALVRYFATMEDMTINTATEFLLKRGLKTCNLSAFDEKGEATK